MVSLFALGIVGLFAAIGVAIAGIGVVRLRKWWTMRRLDPAGPIAGGEGLQEFEGRAHAVDGTLTAPFTGAESLVCKHEVERYSAGGEGSNWRTVGSETRTVPFEIDHAGSSVAVDADGAQTLLTGEFELDLRDTDDPPERVRAYLKQKEEFEYDDDAGVELGPLELGGNRRYRFIEERLDDGEEVYVLGTVERDPAKVPPGSDARLVVAPENRGLTDSLFGDPFVVSDTGEAEATRRQFRSGLFTLGIGLLFAALPVAVIALILV